LPNREACVEMFEWLARELTELGGQASLCEGRFLESSTDDDIAHRFASARDADYAEVGAAAKTLLAKLEAKRLPADRIKLLAEQHGKLVHRLAEIVAIDFLDAPGRVPAEGLVTAVGRALPRDGKVMPAPKLERAPRPSGATWVTRAGVHVDRIASAWLIRRFIDPRARFKFVSAQGYTAEPGEVRFDMFDAEFTHVGDRCTFEVLMERMGLDDVALTPIAEIIHDLDLHDDKFRRDETIGVRSTVDGICVAASDDDDRIAAVTPMLDGLYSHFSVQARRATRSPRRRS
ncbi:MAG TPA: chromate resistance protein ChrB domain-containing protein, partial [Kofleriaceae bacterium]|nr:chromate resistance protein ChrB domain-containing protein [Kofleriaceae bacterium]